MKEFQSIRALRADLRSGATSAEALSTHYLSRIKRFDPKLNALISLNEHDACSTARAIDKDPNALAASPLAGIPIIHKDIFSTQGIKTSCASKMLDNYLPPFDATVVAKLKQAHMVMLGKSNMDEFAMGSGNYFSFYGAVHNPWDLARVPGGSSGGSAAAVAAGLAPVATGTDTGGSVRQPAAFCNVTGFKPTYGRISRYGMIAFASSFDQCGFFANHAEDIAYLLEATAGLDARDSTSSAHACAPYVAQLDQSLKGRVIGVPRAFLDKGLDAGIAQRFEAALDDMAKAGAIIKDIELPNAKLGIPVYYAIACAEASSNLARYDGVRYGYRSEHMDDLQALYTNTRSEGFGAEVQRRILLGTFVLSAESYEAYYMRALKVRRLVLNDFLSVFNGVDLIATPTSPRLPFKASENQAHPEKAYWEDIYTAPVNLAGLPAISLPMGLCDGLPSGLQLIAPHFEEAALLSASHQYQQISNHHLAKPDWV